MFQIKLFWVNKKVLEGHKFSPHHLAGCSGSISLRNAEGRLDTIHEKPVILIFLLSTSETFLQWKLENRNLVFFSQTIMKVASSTVPLSTSVLYKLLHYTKLAAKFLCVCQRFIIPSFIFLLLGTERPQKIIFTWAAMKFGYLLRNQIFYWTIEGRTLKIGVSMNKGWNHNSAKISAYYLYWNWYNWQKVIGGLKAPLELILTCRILTPGSEPGLESPTWGQRRTRRPEVLCWKSSSIQSIGFQR